MRCPGARPAFLFRCLPLNNNVPSIAIPTSRLTQTLSAIVPFSSTDQRRQCSQGPKSQRAHSSKTTAGSSLQTLHNSTKRSFSRSPTMADPVQIALNSNSEWRRNLSETNPDLFEGMAKGQSPQILWIGCADSRCPETTILGLKPGDVFCHRNIANILMPTDLNSLSVIQYAVQYLKVKHIIVCGHTSCGGVAAALDNKALCLIDTWLMPLRAVRQRNIKLLESLEPKERALKLVDLNVRNSISTLLENPTVISAIAERGLKVHGMIFDVSSGEVNELDITEDDEIIAERVAAFKTG